MTKIGILVHVYNIEDPGWEYIAWGDPTRDKFGSLPLLCYALLTSSPGNQIDQVVIHNGPSKKDGLKEGEYTKQFLLDNLHRLVEFPRLAGLLNNRPENLNLLKQQVENIIIGSDLLRTADEIMETASLFRSSAIQRIVQIACASHAPRCLQTQIGLRAEGKLSLDQLWSVLASDVFYAENESSSDVVIFEKPHLPYDPMIHADLTAPDILGRYFALSPEDKKRFLVAAKEFIDDRIGDGYRAT